MQAIGDVDGDKFEDVVVFGQGYEDVFVTLVRAAPSNVDKRVIFSG